MRTLALALVLMSNEPPPQVTEPEPPRGRVSLGLGIASMVAGTPMLFTGIVFSVVGKPVPGAPPVGPIVLGTGIAAVTFGTIGVIVGVHLDRKWKAWAARNPERVSRLQLAPTGWAGREGFGFALAGRF